MSEPVKIVQRNERPVLVINMDEAAQYHVDVSADSGPIRPDAEKLLGLIIGQAYHDDMSALKLSCADDKSVSLHYYGPRNDDSPRWWDMTPPPAAAYNLMAQAIVMLTEFNLDAAPHGHIHAQINGKDLRISINISSWNNITLEFPQ